MEGGFIGNREASIVVPENMSDNTANRCFMLGMHNLLYINDGGLNINFGVSDDEGIMIQSMSFKDEYAVAVRRFCEAIAIYANSGSREERITALRDKGVEILEDLEKGEVLNEQAEDKS